MKKTTMVLIALLLSSCAGPPRKMPDLSHCGKDDHDCLIESLDETRHDCDKSKMFSFMRGYQPASLRHMKEQGRLEIIEMNPALSTVLHICGAAGIAPLAWTEYVPGKHGGMYSAKIVYPGGLPWSKKMLVHELGHAQGFWGGRIHGSDYGLTSEMKEIMAREDKTSWVDTNFYKEHDWTDKADKVYLR